MTRSDRAKDTKNTPIYLLVSHNSVISSSSNYFDVSVSDPEGRPVKDLSLIHI